MMTCVKVISRNFPEHYDSDCLYEGEFLQLDKELQYIRHAKLLVTTDRLLLEHLDHEESDSSSKNRLELSRSSVNINFLKNSPYTFTLNVKNSGNANNVYQLCDRPESWADFLKSIDLQEIINDDNVLPQVTYDEDLDDTYTDSESESSSFSDDSDADDIGLPRCLTSLYVGQGLDAMSMLNVNNAMMMMNPGHVRRLNKRSGLFRGSLDILSQPGSETDDFLSHANSYPQITCNAKPERWNSLPILSELDNILLDDDLQFERFNRHKRDRFGTKHHVRREGTETANYHSSAVYRTEYGIKHATSPKELLLNEEIRKLITQPSDIKFCNTAGRRKDSSELEPISEAIIHENFTEPTKVCPTEQSKPRTYEIIDTTGGKFKLNLKRLWKRREKTNISKSGGKTYSSNQQERESNHVMFINKVALDTQGTVPATPSFAVSNDRRGGLGHDVSGKKENVVVSSVSKQRESSTNSVPSPKEKNKFTINPPTTFTGKNTIGKKIVKKFLSPMSTLRSVSEEEKNLDMPQVTGLGYKSGNTNDVPVEDRRKKLLDTNPLHIAQELTLIDKELLVRIPWSELSTCGWMTKHKYARSPSVMEMVEFFNRIALLIASEILFEVDPLMRVRVISKVVQVAEKLHALGNFNSLKALLGGLQCTPIYRLKETWRQVSSKRKKSFRGLTKLMSEDDNFAAYRKEVDNLMNQKTPCLPFLGDFLTQIAQTQTYLACRKKSPDPPKEEILEENIPNPSTPTPKSSRKKTRSRTSLVKRGSVSFKTRDSRFSKSSPNLPASCVNTPERAHSYRAQRFRRCRSWQYSNDSGIQVNNSTNSSLSASSASFLTSNTSIGSGTYACQNKNSTNDDRGRTTSHHHTPSNSTSTPVSSKTSLKKRLRRNQSASEKSLSNSDSGSSLKTKLSFMRSFRRSKSMDQSPSSVESLPKLGPSRKENRNGSVKTCNGKIGRRISEAETEEGTELQLWHFHLAAIQYSFPSRPRVKDFLLTAPFNSEEDNYKLSLQREPPNKPAAS